MRRRSSVVAVVGGCRMTLHELWSEHALWLSNGSRQVSTWSGLIKSCSLKMASAWVQSCLVALGIILGNFSLLDGRNNEHSWCCLCSSIETIQHLFFDCYFVSFVWNTAHIAFGIQPPTSFANLFGSWLYGLRPKLNNQILLGAPTLCWAIWLNKNDMIFNKAKSNIFI